MRIGFDFDKVFINYPPMIPYFLIDFLYKGTSVFKKKITNNNSLHYRFPGLLEQRVRILSHYPIFRHPIVNNLLALQKISKDKTIKTYLISSRFSFLKKRTDIVVRKHLLDEQFDGIYFNFDNKQPHLFKEETIKKLKIDTYIDDDLQLCLYLAKKMPKIKIFWVKNGRKADLPLPKNIVPIKGLDELINYLKLK